MGEDLWPVAALRIVGARVELRWPSYDDLQQLAQRAVDGIHPKDEMPFGVPWTDGPPQDVARSTMQWNWRMWGALTPQDWHLPFVTVVDGQVVGTQELMAKDFAVTREVHTGSWLGQRFQRRGIGTEMRAAVLHLAFTGLGAQWATTSAYSDNAASNGVSTKLGYQQDGIDIAERRGQPATLQRYRLSRADWERRAAPGFAVHGFALHGFALHGVDACRALLGAD